MSEKKMPLSVGAENGGEGQCVIAGFEKPSGDNDTTVREFSQGRIAKLLVSMGAVDWETRVSTKELVTAAGLKTARQLQEEISKEREFSPICSDGGGGYWLADPATVKGRAEIHSSAITMLSRGWRTVRTGRNMLKHIPEVQ